jgi:uncharacterized protein
MLTLDLGRLEKEGRVQLQQEVPVDDPLLAGSGARLRSPLRVALEAQRAGADIVVRGRLATAVEMSCRRCLQDVVVGLDEPVSLVFTPGLDPTEAARQELYPLPARARELDLRAAVREHLLLAVPQYALCREACRGLCPRCGTDLNEGPCACRVEDTDERWARLRNLSFE